MKTLSPGPLDEGDADFIKLVIYKKGNIESIKMFVINTNFFHTI